MGPLRGRLIAALLLLPTPAMAQVCATLRPGWAPETGPVSALAEAALVFASFPGLVILALFALCLWRGWWPLCALTALACVAFAGLLVLGSGSALRARAVAEGCIGAPWLGVAALVVIAATCLYRLWRRFG